MSKKILGIFEVILGNLLIAVAVEMFIVPYNVLTGGLAGIAVCLEPLFHINPSMFISISTYLLFILGFISLGKEFSAKTLVSTIVYPVFISLLSGRLPIPDIDPLLASIYTGVISGIGVGLTFRNEASTGGMDIPPLILHKLTNIPVATLLMIVDGCTVALGLFTYGISSVLIGLVSVYITSITIDKTLTLGSNSAKQVTIISESAMIISQRIQDDLLRGVTILEGRGGYKNEHKDVVMTVIYNNQYNHLIRIVHEVDPSAFVICNDTNEIRGEGFTSLYRI